MKPLTILRAAAWLGFVLIGWSLNLRWGADPALPTGPPAHFERPVVGAMLLGLVAAFSLSISGSVRSGRPPALWAKGLSILAAVGAAILIGWLQTRGPSTTLSGSGWLWSASGAALVLGATSAALALRNRAPVAKKPPHRKRR